VNSGAPEGSQIPEGKSIPLLFWGGSGT
jgi:hypothetical protein